jgi:hypothetical protein
MNSQYMNFVSDSIATLSHNIYESNSMEFLQDHMMNHVKEILLNVSLFGNLADHEYCVSHGPILAESLLILFYAYC